MENTDGTIVALSLAGGSCVLLGYTFLLISGVGKTLYSYFRNKEKKIFLILTFFSVISYFYLFYWAGFSGVLDEDDWERDLYIGSLALYLAGASLWSVQVYNIVKNKKSRGTEKIALLITALGTIGTLVSVACAPRDRYKIGVSGQDQLLFGFAIPAASFLVIQHVFFDLFYWSEVIHKRASKK